MIDRASSMFLIPWVWLGSHVSEATLTAVPPKHSSLPFAAAELTARLGQPPRPEESRA